MKLRACDRHIGPKGDVATRILVSEGRVKAYYLNGDLLVLDHSGSSCLTISAAGKATRQLCKFAVRSQGIANKLSEVRALVAF